MKVYDRVYNEFVRKGLPPTQTKCRRPKDDPFHVLRVFFTTPQMETLSGIMKNEQSCLRHCTVAE